MDGDTYLCIDNEYSAPKSFRYCFSANSSRSLRLTGRLWGRVFEISPSSPGGREQLSIGGTAAKELASKGPTTKKTSITKGRNFIAKTSNQDHVLRRGPECV